MSGFAGGTLLQALVPVVQQLDPQGHVPQPLRYIARTFQELQQTRHEADYDLSWSFSREEVLALYGQVRKILEGGKPVCQDHPEWVRFFLYCLFLWDRWRQ